MFAAVTDQKWEFEGVKGLLDQRARDVTEEWGKKRLKPIIWL